jgi:hypothetical protein
MRLEKKRNILGILLALCVITVFLSSHVGNHYIIGLFTSVATDTTDSGRGGDYSNGGIKYNKPDEDRRGGSSTTTVHVQMGLTLIRELPGGCGNCTPDNYIPNYSYDNNCKIQGIQTTRQENQRRKQG